jgi:hypothetical protein
MKVIDLGHGARAIDPDMPTDRLASLTFGRLKKSKVSDEAIAIIRRYLKETSDTTELS